MRDPRLVDHASLAPGLCFTCNSITGPFIDTMSDLPLPEGRIYICLHNCLNRYLRLAGALPVEDADALKNELSLAGEHIVDLQSELKAAEDDKVIPLAEVIPFLDRYFKKHGHKPGDGKPKVAA